MARQQIDLFTIMSAALGLSAVASILLTPRALFSRSWLVMWVAALASFVVSIIGMFSIGAFVFVLTCVQLGAVVALRRSASPLIWLAGMLVGAAVWVAVVPVQLLGFRWLGGFGMYQVVGLLGLILTLLPIGVPRVQSRPGPAR